MPKGKVIEERPRKRRHVPKPEDVTPDAPPVVVRQKRPNEKPSSTTVPTARLRFSKAKNAHAKNHPFVFSHPYAVAIAFFVLLAVSLLGFLGYQLYIWYLAGMVKTPIALPGVIASYDSTESSSSLFWGSYRPGLYFGMKHRSPGAVQMGLMWTLQNGEQPQFRHLCDSNDGVLRYVPMSVGGFFL